MNRWTSDFGQGSDCDQPGDHHVEPETSKKSQCFDLSVDVKRSLYSHLCIHTTTVQSVCERERKPTNKLTSRADFREETKQKN